MGAGGEPVDWRRTMGSHGVADLLPNRLDEERWMFATVLDVGGRAQPVQISESRPGYALVEGAKATVPVVRHMLRLDEDLSRFYALSPTTPSWRGRRTAPAGCCAARPCSRTSSRRSARPTARGRPRSGWSPRWSSTSGSARPHVPVAGGDGRGVRRRSTATSRAPAIAAPTCRRSPPTSPTARSTSRRSTAAATCPTTKWRSGCSRSRASARTRPRT